MFSENSSASTDAFPVNTPWRPQPDSRGVSAAARTGNQVHARAPAEWPNEVSLGLDYWAHLSTQVWPQCFTNETVLRTTQLPHRQFKTFDGPTSVKLRFPQELFCLFKAFGRKLGVDLRVAVAVRPDRLFSKPVSTFVDSAFVLDKLIKRFGIRLISQRIPQHA
jgi:hypothetical protein